MSFMMLNMKNIFLEEKGILKFGFELGLLVMIYKINNLYFIICTINFSLFYICLLRFYHDSYTNNKLKTLYYLTFTYNFVIY